MSPPTVAYLSFCADRNNMFICHKVNQGVVSEAEDVYTLSGCGGIVGNNSITTNYTSNAAFCPNIETLAKNLNGATATSGFTLGHCNGDSNCGNVEAGYWNGNSYENVKEALDCYWDNDGWNCVDCVDCNINNNAKGIRRLATKTFNCLLQWPVPSPLPGPISTINNLTATLWYSNNSWCIIRNRSRFSYCDRSNLPLS